MSKSNPHHAVLPQHRDLYYGGGWQVPLGGYVHTFNPANQADLGPVASANTEDVDPRSRRRARGVPVLA